MLSDLEKRTFQYFINEADPKTGLVKDRAGNFDKDKYIVSSIAATGFGLAALVIGAERKYIPRQEAYERALKTLQFAPKLPHEYGWLYHFVDMRTGERAWKCEASTIDTALWIAGVLAAGQYFKGTEAERLAHQLYDRIDFEWARTDGGARPHERRLTMGWRPETGFIESRWKDYSEQPLLNLLALSSTTHPVPADVWNSWEQEIGVIGPYRALGIRLPLFVHQYAHCWIDLKGRPDSTGRDFWKNTVDATLANRWYCIHRASEYPGFGPLGWGLSASDGPDGYRAYGPTERDCDGTLSPIGVAAAVPSAPEQAVETLTAMKRQHGDRIWGRYGFSAYNLKRDWRGDDMVGIDAGAALILLDLYRHKDGLIPILLEKAVLSRGLKRAGFAVKR